MKFFIKDFFSKRDQFRRRLRIWSYLLKKSLMENFIFLCSESGTSKRKSSVCQQELEEYENQSKPVQNESIYLLYF